MGRGSSQGDAAARTLRNFGHFDPSPFCPQCGRRHTDTEGCKGHGLAGMVAKARAASVRLRQVIDYGLDVEMEKLRRLAVARVTLGEIIGDDLRTRREARGWSVFGMASRLGWHRPVYGRFERGIHTQDLEGLSMVARVHGVTVLTLIGPALDAFDAQERGRS